MSNRPDNTRDLMTLYLRQDYDALTERLLGALGQVRQGAGADLLVDDLLYFLTKPDYVLHDRYAAGLLRMQPLVADLVAVSKHENTDPQLQILREMPEGLLKFLVLCSARNTVGIDRKALFDADPHYASMWYMAYLDGAESCAAATTCRNLREHVAAIDPRYVLFAEEAVDVFSQCTYIDPDAARRVRQTVNRAVQSACGSIVIRNTPRRNRVAVLTGRWQPGSRVHRSVRPLLAALADDYDITLVHLGPGQPQVDDLFTDVRRVRLQGGGLALGAVADNDFQLAFYPDVGAGRESIYLANLRLAPIQMTGCGCPVSTFGSQIDYFFGAADVELADRAEVNYSERLVLMPGLGLHPVCGDYPPRHPPRDHDGVAINCPWAPVQTNHPLLLALRDVIHGSERHVTFQFFPTAAAGRPHAPRAFRDDLESVLGAAHVRVVGDCPRGEYMVAMESADLSADAFPVGGCDGVVDSLVLGLPVVVWQGTTFHNRAAAQLLVRLGLEELVATSADEYTEILLELVRDDGYRDALANRIAGMDVRGTLFDPREPEYFKKAVDFLIAHHDRLRAEGRTEPIIIR